jgi:hypothetical protein
MRGRRPFSRSRPQVESRQGGRDPERRQLGALHRSSLGHFRLQSTECVASRNASMTHPVIELPPLRTGAARRRGPNRTVEAATEGALRFGPHRL